MNAELIMTGVLLLTVFVLLWFVLCRRKRRLSKGARGRFKKLWDEIEARDDPVRRIMEADALLAKALTDLAYRGSLGDQLKAVGERLPNIEAVWRAHKLRNRLVHEPGSSVTEKHIVEAISAFKTAIESLY